MTQDRVLRKVAAALFKGIDVVNAFADERTFREDVLIDVGDDAGIRIDARIVGEELHKSRPLRTRQADADARL